MEELTKRQTDRQDRKDRTRETGHERQDTRKNKTDSSSKTADKKTEGDGQTDSDVWLRRHTVQYAKGKGIGFDCLRKGRRKRA